MINKNTIARSAGTLALILGAAFLICTAVALIYKESDCVTPFLSLALPLLIVGACIMWRVSPSKKPLTLRNGFLVAAFSWILMSAFGALPFVMTGATDSYVDAFFETCSGFSTTGASVIADVEALPMSLLFWRAFTHWLGGMGVLVLAAAMFRGTSSSVQNIFKAESPGPSLLKIVPKISDAARDLYTIYIAMTILEILLLLPSGMGIFDSVTHTFSTVGTGGFSNYNNGIMHFDSTYVELIITIFMIAAGVNFNLYFFLSKGNFREFVKDEELRLYIKIIAVFSCLIAAYLMFADTIPSPAGAISKGFFQVASIISTTGFASADFAIWPTFCVMALFCLFFVGACSSSTGGGVKVMRILILLKIVKRYVSILLHPNAMANIKVNDKTLPVNTAQNVISFVLLYIATFFVVALVVSLDNFDMSTSLSAAAACLGNIGPGFNEVGPVMNYAEFSDQVKIVLSFAMLCGRLELFSILMLFTRSFWNKDR